MSLKIEIIDDFLSIEDLKKLQSLDLGRTSDKEMNVYVKKIFSLRMRTGLGVQGMKKAELISEGAHLGQKLGRHLARLPPGFELPERLGYISRRSLEGNRR